MHIGEFMVDYMKALVATLYILFYPTDLMRIIKKMKEEKNDT